MLLIEQESHFFWRHIDFRYHTTCIMLHETWYQAGITPLSMDIKIYGQMQADGTDNP